MYERQFDNSCLINATTLTESTTRPTVGSLGHPRTVPVAHAVAIPFLAMRQEKQHPFERRVEALVHPEINYRVVAGVGHGEPVGCCPDKLVVFEVIYREMGFLY